MLSEFALSRFVLHLIAEDTIILPPYKGSALRGGFGWAFKKVVCTMRAKPCEDCLLRSRCIYNYVFETEPAEGSEVLRNYRRVPHPFVIEPPEETKRVYEPGHAITFNIVLIGRAIGYLPYFIYTFEELGRMGIGKEKGKYRLCSVSQILPDSEHAVYSETDRKLRGFKQLKLADYMRENTRSDSAGNNGETEALDMEILTPLRIVTEGDLVVDLKFHHLISSLLRRASTLMYFHCGKRLEADFRGIIERARSVETDSNGLKWHDWERYSQRQGARMKLGGLVGRLSFKGRLREFMELLKLGELVHTGKGTAFGLGRYVTRQTPDKGVSHKYTSDF